MIHDNAIPTLLKWTKAHKNEMIDFLRKIVSIDTSTFNREGVTSLAEIMARELTRIGFSVERPSPESPADPWIKRMFLGPHSVKDIVPSVLGHLDGGRNSGHLLLVGHLDAAFPLGEPLRNPFHIKDQRAYGPAIADMKGGVVGIFFACQSLLETKLARPEQITVLYNADEQVGTVCTRKLIEAESRSADWGLVTESGRSGGQIVGQRAGLATGELIIEGVEAHVGTGFREGRSAIEALCRKVTALHRLHDPDHGVLLNVGKIKGGTRRNLYAGHAAASIDLRSVNTKTWDKVKQKVEKIAYAEELSGIHTTFHLWQHRPPMPWTKMTDRFAILISAIARELGTTIETVSTMGGSDANLIAAQGTPTLCGLGPVGGAVMTQGEYIELPTLAERTALVAALAYKLGQNGL
jgi:glutamate carboxypeptidase